LGGTLYELGLRVLIKLNQIYTNIYHLIFKRIFAFMNRIQIKVVERTYLFTALLSHIKSCKIDILLAVPKGLFDPLLTAVLLQERKIEVSN
jgi:hypothetical protein